MKLRLSISALAAAAMAVVSGCAGSGSKGPDFGHTDIACDATFENIIDQEVDVFEYSYSNRKRDVVVVPYYVSQEAAIDSLLEPDNIVQTIIVGRKLTRAEETRLRNRKRVPRQEKIAVDGVAIIVNNANDIPELSVGDLRNILSGEVTMWDDIYPSRLDTIRVIFDQNGSSLLQYMRDELNDGKPLGGHVYAENSSVDVFNAVSRIKGSIGVIGVSWLSTDMNGVALSKDEVRARSDQSDVVVLDFNPEVKVLPIRKDGELEAYKPYQQYIYDGSYPLHRPIYAITVAQGSTPANAFYTFLTSNQGQKVISLTGVLPARMEPRIVELVQ